MPRDPKPQALAVAHRAQRTELDLVAHQLKARTSFDRALFDAEAAGFSLRELGREFRISHTEVARRIDRHKGNGRK